MEDITPLMEIIRTLRGKNGCEWDRKQTALSMWRCLAEEVYELQDAIVNQDDENTCEELGDVLFQVLFIMEIFNEQGKIPFSRVVEKIAEKMIRRHPHVYENASVTSESELLRQWERIKASEKNGTGHRVQKTDAAPVPSVLDSVPSGMPGLLRALKVSKCAVKEGFEWESFSQILDTVKSEISEFEAALEKEDREDAMMEFGDILFSLVNVARYAGFHPETALSKSTAKFEGRFRLMEADLARENLKLNDLSFEDKERFWDQAKQRYDK